jgi:hypothetical protein
MKVIEHKARYIAEERETVIRYSDDDDMAVVETFNRAKISSMEKLAEAKPDDVEVIRKYYCTAEEPELVDGITVKIPKKWVHVRPTKAVTEAQREASKRNMAKMRFNSQEAVNITETSDSVAKVI